MIGHPQAAVPGPGGELSPAQVCRALLRALDASDGRRRQRKRDQTPDAIGLGVKRALLERAMAEDPPAAAFEAWLLRYVDASDPSCAGAVRSMALAVLEEWRLAHAMPAFAQWLERGAPSADAV